MHKENANSSLKAERQQNILLAQQENYPVLLLLLKAEKDGGRAFVRTPQLCNYFINNLLFFLLLFFITTNSIRVQIAYYRSNRELSIDGHQV